MPTRWLKNLTVNWKKIINRFLLLRLIQLWSKLNNTNHLHELYGEYKFKYHHILRATEELGKNFDSYIAHLFEASNNVIKRNTSVCYFDCTNFYFEKEEENEIHEENKLVFMPTQSGNPCVISELKHIDSEYYESFASLFESKILTVCL